MGSALDGAGLLGVDLAVRAFVQGSEPAVASLLYMQVLQAHRRRKTEEAAGTPIYLEKS